jgi:predicted PurR-regulated permease PerM
VIAISADPFVSRLTDRGLSRTWAVITVVVGPFLVLGALSMLFIAPAAHEITGVVHQVPAWLQHLHDHRSFLGRSEDRYQIIEEAKKQLGTDTSSLADGVMGGGQLLVTIVTGLFLVITLPVAIATAVFYDVFRLAEDYLILPRAMKFAIQVHPLVTILAVLADGVLEGVIGALLAIPVAVAVGLVLDDAVFPRITRR